MGLPPVNGQWRLSCQQLAQLSLAYARLRRGERLTLRECEMVLNLSPDDSMSSAKARYRSLVSGFCRKSDYFDAVLYDLFASAWAQWKAWRRE